MSTRPLRSSLLHLVVTGLRLACIRLGATVWRSETHRGVSDASTTPIGVGVRSGAGKVTVCSPRRWRMGAVALGLAVSHVLRLLFG
jgi:hypothetical protein